jgi:hypothetical protein
MIAARSSFVMSSSPLKIVVSLRRDTERHCIRLPSCMCGAMYADTVLRSAEGAAFPSGYIIAFLSV